MHEMSVALEVCRLAELRVGADTLPRVVTVGVEVGSDAGIEPSSLEFCLEALLAEPPFTGAKPVIINATGDTLRLSWLEVDDGRPED
jgi:Zn finger protein HypA/HybF involved in hydrogenase expression